jgi:hypothetical protein
VTLPWQIDKNRGSRKMNRLERIQEAYAEAEAKTETEQPPQYDPLPKREALPIHLRGAIIHVYLAGRLDALSEVRAR